MSLYAFGQELVSELHESDIIYEDFESGTYDKWTTHGKAFGKVPQNADNNFFAFSQPQGKAKAAVRNRMMGTLVSKPFFISHNWIRFSIKGGKDPHKTCLKLIDIEAKKLIATRIGNGAKWRTVHINTEEYIGKSAQIKVVDAATKGFLPFVGVDNIVFTNTPPQAATTNKASQDSVKSQETTDSENSVITIRPANIPI